MLTGGTGTNPSPETVDNAETPPNGAPGRGKAPGGGHGGMRATALSFPPGDAAREGGAPAGPAGPGDPGAGGRQRRQGAGQRGLKRRAEAAGAGAGAGGAPRPLLATEADEPLPGGPPWRWVSLPGSREPKLQCHFTDPIRKHWCRRDAAVGLGQLHCAELHARKRALAPDELRARALPHRRVVEVRDGGPWREMSVTQYNFEFHGLPKGPGGSKRARGGGRAPAAPAAPALPAAPAAPEDDHATLSQKSEQLRRAPRRSLLSLVAPRVAAADLERSAPGALAEQRARVRSWAAARAAGRAGGYGAPAPRPPGDLAAASGEARRLLEAYNDMAAARASRGNLRVVDATQVAPEWLVGREVHIMYESGTPDHADPGQRYSWFPCQVVGFDPCTLTHTVAYREDGCVDVLYLPVDRVAMELTLGDALPEPDWGTLEGHARVLEHCAGRLEDMWAFREALGGAGVNVVERYPDARLGLGELQVRTEGEFAASMAALRCALEELGGAGAGGAPPAGDPLLDGWLAGLSGARASEMSVRVPAEPPAAAGRGKKGMTPGR